jgi:endonuclease/exonuclease/phosphatase family metal-dependent hydrolase
MKKVFLAMAMISSVVVPAVQAAPRYFNVKLVQWNLHIGLDMTWRFNLKRQADVLNKLDGDIVVLNEVDKNCPRTGYVDMTKELATLTGMCFSQFAGARINPPDGLYGNAILSRYRMEMVGSWLIPASVDETRGMTLMKIYAPNPFLVAITHLCWRQTPEENAQRVKAVEYIDQLISKNNPAKLPVILAGDFNCYPKSDPVDKLAELGWTLEKPIPTFPSKAPKSEIDFVFRKTADNRMEVVDRIGIDEKIASDHIPVINVLKVYRNNERK